MCWPGRDSNHVLVEDLDHVLARARFQSCFDGGPRPCVGQGEILVMC
jgi:hypothetical protein